MADITKVKLGVCNITFNGVDLGHTKGGVEVTYEPHYKEVTVDLYGDTAVDARLMGERLTAKFALAEFTIANARISMPQGEFAGAANARMTIGHKAGQSALADSAQLVLHPVDEGTRIRDIVLHKAVAIESVPIKHTNEDEKVLEITMLALLDESKSDGNYLGLIGDSTA